MLARQFHLIYHFGSMADFDLSSPMRKLAAVVRRETGFDPETVTPERIEELNGAVLPSKAYRKALGGKPRGIDIETFIIPVSGGAITGYLYRAKGIREMTDISPLVIYYHGGGWMLGNMQLYSNLCARMAASFHVPVLSVDYRLAPAAKFPIPVEDCYATLIWAFNGCRYWKVDPDRIFLVGDCAGGNLAAVVSRLARDRKGPSVAGQVLICPITDGRMLTKSYETYKESPTLTAAEMSYYIGNYAREPKDVLDPNFSPLLALDLSRLPDTLVLTAEYDPLKDEGKEFATKLIANDTKANCLEIKGTFHGYIRYPKATGYDETLCAINQMLSGRDPAQIVLQSQKEYSKALREEVKEIKRKTKNYIPVDEK